MDVAGREHGFGLVGPVAIAKPVLNSALAIDELSGSTGAHSKCLRAYEGACFLTLSCTQKLGHFEYFSEIKRTNHACLGASAEADVGDAGVAKTKM
jgi:hypothetical protein